MFYRKHPRYFAPHDDTVVTKQSHKAECDINNILKQYQRTGIITHVQSARADYTDLPDHIDYQQSLNLLLQADEAFSQLPAKVREHFSNDPAQFLAAFSDKDQQDYLREHGFLKPVHAPPPAAAPQVPANDAKSA